MTSQRRRTGRRVVLLVVLALGIATLPDLPATAATITVTSTADHDDGTCDIDCTLREAVRVANEMSGADTVVLPADATILLDRPVGHLQVLGDLTVVGNGATVRAAYGTSGATTRIFHVGGNTGLAPRLTLTDLRLTQGSVIGSGLDGVGGAIRMFDGQLELESVTLETNLSNMGGGAVWAGGGDVTATDSTFTFNQSGGDGGAIACEGCSGVRVTASSFTTNSARNGGAIAVALNATGRLTVERSTFVQNAAFPASAADSAHGGAISVEGGSALVTQTLLTGNGVDIVGVTRTTHGGAIHAAADDRLSLFFSTVSNNRAVRQGGGLLVAGGGSSLIEASTISDNTATDINGTGGGLLSLEPDGTDVINSTVSGNRAGSGGQGIQAGLPPSLAFQPGRVDLLYSTVYDNGVNGLGAASGSTVMLEDTLVGSTTGQNCSGAGTFTSRGHNLEDADSCNLTATGDLASTDPLIGPLADNGGVVPVGPGGSSVTDTHALAWNSPAVNAADPNACGTAWTDHDQRGVSRPQHDRCDIGAFEREEEHAVLTKTVSPSTIAVGESATFTITYTAAGPASTRPFTITDTMPAALTVVDATTTLGTCTVTGQTVFCDLGVVPVGTTVTVTITVIATAEGDYRNAAVAAPTDGPAGGGEVTAQTDVQVEDGATPPDDGELPPAEEEFPPEGTSRVEGPTRIETAIEGSQAVFDDGEAGAVVLTRSDLFPDAQAGTPLAIQLDAPMLLSQPAELNPLTEAEIQRVLPDGATVYLLGGTAALSQAVEDRIDVLGFDAIRLGGTNRFQTAAIIADAGLDDPPTLLCADGGDFPDSVVAGAATLGAGDAAVILTSGSDLPPETSAYLQGREDDPEIIAVGGSAAVACDGATESLVGATRFETAIAVAERFFTTPPVVGMATGLDFPDALTGGAIIGRGDVGPGPMLLTTADALPDSVAAYLTDNADTIDSVVIFGGTAAISQAVEDQITTALG